MARVKTGSLLNELRGNVGPFKVREVGGQTVVSLRETGKRRKSDSTALAQNRQRMREANAYAKQALRDPAVRALYAAGISGRITSAHSVAVTDYMRAPVITALDWSGYRGQPGDCIGVRAADNFAVTAVRVRLAAPDGSLLEEGPATLQADGGWAYAGQARPALVPSVRCVVEAWDRPGNRATQTWELRAGNWVLC